MTIKGISTWEDAIIEDVFFLKDHEGAFEELYKDAKLRETKRKGKKNPDETIVPQEQLSPKGLSLISYLYATLKDGSEAQPLVADSDKSLQHITRLMDEAPTGTSVTVIFQPSNMHKVGDWEGFARVHKTVIKFEKHENGINVISMDSLSKKAHSELCFKVIDNEIRKQALEKRKKPSTITYYRPSSSHFQGRQKSEYECGIFAIKDARQMNRDQNFSRILNQEEYEVGRIFKRRIYDYRIPPEYLKAAQSSTEQLEITELYPDNIVTRKSGTREPRTLSETYENHGVAYANDFAKKYNKQVKKFIEDHKFRPGKIKSAVEYYDAANMTYDRLVRVYGPHRQEKSETSALSLMNEVSILIEAVLKEKDRPLFENGNFFKMFSWALLQKHNTILTKVFELFQNENDNRIKILVAAIVSYNSLASDITKLPNTIVNIEKKIIPIDIEDGQGNTPLILAAKNGDADACIKLIKLGANLLKVDNKGNSVLHYAAMNGMTDLCSTLIAHGVQSNQNFEDNENPLMLAIKNKHWDICQLLIHSSDLNERGVNRKTALGYALEEENFPLCKDLITAGSDLNAEQASFKTPLQIAIEKGYNEFCIFLLSNGAHVNTKNINDPPILIALNKHNIEVCLALLTHGLNLDLNDPKDEEIFQKLKRFNDPKINTKLDEIFSQIKDKSDQLTDESANKPSHESTQEPLQKSRVPAIIPGMQTVRASSKTISNPEINEEEVHKISHKGTHRKQ